MKEDLEKNIAESIIKNIPHSDSSLFHGKSGIIISLAYYQKYQKNLSTIENRKIEKGIKECINSIISDVENLPMNGSLASGITGIAYALKIAQTLGDYPEIDNDWFEAFEEVIISSFENSLRLKDYDLLRGATGNILYLVNFSENNSSLIEKYIESLFESAIWTSDDTCHWIFYSFNEKTNQLEYNNEVVNIGLAHGISSIISLLSELFKKGYEKEKCHKLIQGAINYLKSVENSNSVNQFDGIIYLKEKGISSSRLGWCYGDISTGLSVLKAGDYCDNKDWLEYGHDICLNSTKRTFETAYLEEHGLCHGFFGTMHIYNRLYSKTGRSEYLKMKNYWYDKGVEIRDFNCNTTGFFQTEVEENQTISKFTTPSLIQGLSGVLLCLISDEEIRYPWDNIFLLNI